MCALKIGNKAPDFKASNQDNKTISLSDFSGKKLIIAIYVRDGSSGCVMDLQNIQASFSQLKKLGFSVVGVAVNSIDSHKRFKEKLGLSFDLLSDPDMKLIKAYDAYGPKGKKDGEVKYGVIRRQVLIGEDEQILGVVEKVDAKNSGQQILDLIATL